MVVRVTPAFALERQRPPLREPGADAVDQLQFDRCPGVLLLISDTASALAADRNTWQAAGRRCANRRIVF